MRRRRSRFIRRRTKVPRLQNFRWTCDYRENVNFLDRFELLDLLRDGMLHEEQVQTYRARERVTGRSCEVHFAASPELLDGLVGAMDRGSHEGKFYAVTAEPAALDSAGAWRIKPQEPAGQQAPGDFTRMFQLRQAPEPVAVPVSKPVPAPSASVQPGEFTRAFQRPASAPPAPTDAPEPGQPGEFTRMFQKPVPEPTAVASQPMSRSRVGLTVGAIVVLLAIAVFILVRTLY